MSKPGQNSTGVPVDIEQEYRMLETFPPEVRRAICGAIYDYSLGGWFKAFHRRRWTVEQLIARVKEADAENVARDRKRLEATFAKDRARFAASAANRVQK